MSVVGHQNFWVAGSRIYFKRNDSGSTKYPWQDLGVVETINPAVTVEKATLYDSDGGRKQKIDETVTSIDEMYDVVTNNLSLENLALMFMSGSPAAFTQSAATAQVSHELFGGRLVKILDSSGDKAYRLAGVDGIAIGTTTDEVLTDIDVGAKEFVITGDVTSDPGFGAGKHIIVQGTTAADGTYTVVSTSAATDTTVVVAEDIPGADEASITAVCTQENAGVIYDIGDDWEVVSLDRGFIRIVADGGIDSAISDGDAGTIFYRTAAISGLRLINPQALQGSIEGQAMLVWGREDNDEQTVREFAVSITPNTTNFTPDDYSSMTLTFAVINDLSAAVPAGRMIHFKGDVPSLS